MDQSSNHLQSITKDYRSVKLWNDVITYPAKGLSADERDMLVQLRSYLQLLPNNETYKLAEWSDADIEKANIVNNALITANLKMNHTISTSWNSFISQCEVLVEELRPLYSH